MAVSACESSLQQENCVPHSVLHASFVTGFSIICVLTLKMHSMNYASMSTSSSLQSLNMDFNYEFVNLDPKYKCVKCNTWLKYPMQIPCGHRICRSCVEELFASNSGTDQGVPCPSGEEGCELIEQDKVYPDFSATREIKQQKVFCIYKQYGCQATPTLSKFKEHIDHCSCVTECKFCKEHLPAESIENHIKNECREAVISCIYNCSTPDQPRRQMEEHHKQCPKKPRQCKYYPVGCTVELADVDMLQHEADNTQHLELLTEHISTLELDNSRLKGRVESALVELDSTRTQLSRCLQENAQLKQTLAALQESQRLLEERQREAISTHNVRIARIEESCQSFDEQSQGLAQLQATCSELDARITNLAQNVPRGETGLPEDVRKKFIAHDRTIGLHDVRLSEIDLRLQCTETANYDGVLIWKIGEYRQRKLQAVGGRILSLYSQPFYTSRYGYKMCARIYLNGDGVGRGTHLSLFFVVMQGDYDEIIAWPFRQKVTLMLIDQKHNRRHLSDTFRPDPTSTSFQKPTMPMNVASGCPLFVEQKVLEDEREGLYLQNDTIFIKVVVDTSDLLNP